MEYLLEMKNITKVYGNGVRANHEVNFNVKPGEIHALMGENGAGKSTLMKVLFGIERPDEGEIWYKGQPVQINSPAQAIELGIGMVNQHFMLVDDLNVHENVFLGMEPTKGIFIDHKQAAQRVRDLANKFNLQVHPMAQVSDLSVSKKQKVEILKVLARGSELIILDEPTAVLTPQETRELFVQLKLLKQDGYTVVFISHKINEVMEICDRITVLRRGQTVSTIDVGSITPEGISKLMVGRDVLLDVEKPPAEVGDALLSLENVTVFNEFGIEVVGGVSLKLRAGEILGIAGVEGNGQNELAETIFGMQPVSHGQIKLHGHTIQDADIHTRRKSGLGYIPEDRIETGSAVSLSVWENLISDKTDQYDIKDSGLLNRKLIDQAADEIIQRYGVILMDKNQPMAMLSGGNMQKVVVARELSSQPSVLIANQPTRGIDVGAQEFIWQELTRFRTQGHAVLLISADLSELIKLSDRIIVMTKGQIVAEFTNMQTVTEDELGIYMLGADVTEVRQ